MTYTDESMDEYAAWAEQVEVPTTEIDREREWTALNGPEDRYAGLTPTEQAEQVDEDWREDHYAREAQRMIPHRWQ